MIHVVQRTVSSCWSLSDVSDHWFHSSLHGRSLHSGPGLSCVHNARRSVENYYDAPKTNSAVRFCMYNASSCIVKRKVLDMIRAVLVLVMVVSSTPPPPSSPPNFFFFFHSCWSLKMSTFSYKRKKRRRKNTNSVRRTGKKDQAKLYNLRWRAHVRQLIGHCMNIRFCQ